MSLKCKIYQVIIISAIVSMPLLQVSLFADAKSGGNYSYCKGPGFSEPRGFGYRDHRQWRSEYLNGDQEKRNAFLERSRELSRIISAKEHTLMAELEQATVDKDRAMQLQKELSALWSKMDQYQLEHLIEMRKSDAGDINEEKN